MKGKKSSSMALFCPLVTLSESLYSWHIWIGFSFKRQKHLILIKKLCSKLMRNLKSLDLLLSLSLFFFFYFKGTYVSCIFIRNLNQINLEHTASCSGPPPHPPTRETSANATALPLSPTASLASPSPRSPLVPRAVLYELLPDGDICVRFDFFDFPKW